MRSTIVVRADALVDDDAWMICALQEAGRLGEQVLVAKDLRDAYEAIV